MGDQNMPRLVCNYTVFGVDALRVITTPAGPQGSFIKQIVGVGNPYWIWNTIPNPTKVIGADFSNAPICSDNIAENNANAAPLLADPPSVNPEDVLIYSEE